MPEQPAEFAQDSQWPAFFPSAVCIVSASNGRATVIEREVGASIVNRFPYVVAVSLSRESLTERHHVRRSFMDTLEEGGVAALQFLVPGPELDAVLGAIARITDSEAAARVAATGLPTRTAATNGTRIFEAAYLVYEARLAKPQRDFDGKPIFDRPWVDVGSHRIYFLEINAITLRSDIAAGDTQIRWRSLPSWSPLRADLPPDQSSTVSATSYTKGYAPRYAFPSSATTAFEYDEMVDGRAIKHLPPLPEDQVEVDDDRARWPCFFPSSAGLITSWNPDGTPNLMPCGSTTVVSRHPFVVAPCVSYARINSRYALRHSLDVIRQTGRFGCSVPFISDRIIDAIKYAGNISITHDRDKVRNSGLHLAVDSNYGPVIAESPIHFDCEVVDEVRLGTHIMFLGKVRRILVRTDVGPDNPLEWYPWATLTSENAPAPV
jgi:flavin reductase (DIM6/NTAB) family NADH-FMN oxidoreductase RutF